MISAQDILAANILIVDDLPANVLLLGRMLRGAGYGVHGTVASTTRPDEVCELHLKHRYDLILLDLEMPRMDGFQVMENLREVETGGYLPVLVITAQPGHKIRALKAGARDFVSKPFDLAEVLLRVHNLLEVRLLQSESKRLYDRVVAEQAVSARLLMNLLPESVSDRLRAPSGLDEFGSGDADRDIADALIKAGYAEITALFADIMEFTKFAEGGAAQVLVGVLGDIADRLAGAPELRASHDVRVLEDAYLAAAGMPDRLADRSIKAAIMALDLARALDRFNGLSRYQLKVQIGLETSAVAEAEPRTVRFDV